MEKLKTKDVANVYTITYIVSMSKKAMKKPNKKLYSFRFDEQLIEALRELAEKDKRSLTNYLELMIHKKIESESSSPSK